MTITKYFFSVKDTFESYGPYDTAEECLSEVSCFSVDFSECIFWNATALQYNPPESGKETLTERVLHD